MYSNNFFLRLPLSTTFIMKTKKLTDKVTNPAPITNNTFFFSYCPFVLKCSWFFEEHFLTNFVAILLHAQLSSFVAGLKKSFPAISMSVKLKWRIKYLKRALSCSLCQHLTRAQQRLFPSNLIEFDRNTRKKVRNYLEGKRLKELRKSKCRKIKTLPAKQTILL